MDDDTMPPTPPTQPSGALVPPPSGPPTSIALATPEPPVPPRPDRLPFMKSDVSARDRLQRLFNRTLDNVDELADAVAQGLRLR